MEGFEPPTPCFVGKYSYPLSYTGINKIMTDYCIDLDFPIKPLANNITIADLPPDSWSFLKRRFINPELIDFLNSVGLIFMGSVFVKRPDSKYLIHVDGNKIIDKAKLNWSLNDDHIMNWYKIKTTENKPIQYYDGEKFLGSDSTLSDKRQRKYIEYTNDEVELVHSAKVGYPSLVQAGAPHSVKVFSGERKCISILLLQKNYQPISMSVAKHLFRDYIKHTIL
jgi:hypothetical protein